jgi:hypothetical protein
MAAAAINCTQSKASPTWSSIIDSSSVRDKLDNQTCQTQDKCKSSLKEKFTSADVCSYSLCIRIHGSFYFYYCVKLLSLVTTAAELLLHLHGLIKGHTDVPLMLLLLHYHQLLLLLHKCKGSHSHEPTRIVQQHLPYCRL